MIATGLRHEGPDGVERAARYIVANPHPLVTGFGMAGDERMHQPKDFAKAFDIARDAGLAITVHAGELVGAQSVRGALDHLKPARIGHGVRAIEDPALVDRLAGEGVVLEVCPGSNIAIGVFPSYEAHPFPKLRDAGVRVTLSSDDPPFFHTSLAREYETRARISAWTTRPFSRRRAHPSRRPSSTRTRGRLCLPVWIDPSAFG
jgi:adenosine deaminase